MNVIDYALRLGKFLRKTPEGQKLIQLHKIVQEKYKANEAFWQFDDYIEHKSGHYYFFSWDMAYRCFMGVLDDTEMEHRNIFLKTAEIVAGDSDIKELSKIALEFGKIFEEIVGVVISGGEVKKLIKTDWKYKIENGIEDLQISLERTMFTREIIKYGQVHMEEFKSGVASEYAEKREKSELSPYSDKVKELMQQYPDVSEDYKRIMENIYLMRDVVKKGMFYGFWNQLNVIEESFLIDATSLKTADLKEVVFFTYRYGKCGFKKGMVISY